MAEHVGMPIAALALTEVWRPLHRPGRYGLPPPVVQRLKGSSGRIPGCAETPSTKTCKDIFKLSRYLRGMGHGVMQIAIRHRTNAWRVVHVVECAGSLWVLHAFQKKSRTTLEVTRRIYSFFFARFCLVSGLVFHLCVAFIAFGSRIFANQVELCIILS